MPLSLHVAADDVLCITGAMPEPRAPPQNVPIPQARRGANGQRTDPFPQALDSKPDHVVASLPVVASDSKPKLAETVGVLQLPPPTLSAGNGSRLF